MFPIISIGPFSVPAPSIILLVGYLAGSFLLDKKAQSYSIDSKILDRALWIGTISTLIGARLSYIVTYPAAFRGNFLSVFSINFDLLDPLGGFLIGIAVVFFLISSTKIDYWTFLDSLTPFLGSILPAYFLSRFAAGAGYGLPTNLPWGLLLWGTTRHPVQLYMFCFALVVLTIFLYYFPISNQPSGSTFLLFSNVTFSYLLFLTAYQESTISILAGIRANQILFWFVILITLILLNSRYRAVIKKV